MSYLGEDLILVLSPPRSGSTLLQRMLGSHSQVQTHPEPHVLTPLAFQGVFHQVERAGYNHRVAAQALREFVDFLPGGESDYLDACREYCRELYGRARAVTGKRYFLDKTPNYADTILPFVARLLPKARFVVLVRHPVAQIASHANTFVGGDFQRALFQRDIPGTFVPPLARLMRQAAVPFVHVRYEDLVMDPETVLRGVFAHLELAFEEQCVQYGESAHISKTFGDPKIGRHDRPVTDSLNSWVSDLIARPDRESACRRCIEAIAPEDLATIGYPLPSLWAPLESASGSRPQHCSISNRLRDRRWRWMERVGRMLARDAAHRTLVRWRHRLDTLVDYSARWRVHDPR